MNKTIQAIKDNRIRAMIVALLVVVAILAVTLASCAISRSNDGSHASSDTIAAKTEQVDSQEIQEGKIAEGDQPDEDARESVPAVSDNPNSQKNNSGNAVAAETSQDQRGTAISNAGESNHSPSLSQRHWVEDTQKVWVVDKAAWTEDIPQYSAKEVSICNICGADVTGNASAHGKAHMKAGEGSGHHSEVRREIAGYVTVNHEEEGHWETQVVGGHWE